MSEIAEAIVLWVIIIAVVVLSYFSPVLYGLILAN